MRKNENFELTDKIMARHKHKAAKLSLQQKREQQAQWAEQRAAKKENVSFSNAKEELSAEREAQTPPPPERLIKRGPQNERVSDHFETVATKPEPDASGPFHKASEPEGLSRAEQIRRDMEEWRRCYGGHNMGR